MGRSLGGNWRARAAVTLMILCVTTGPLAAGEAATSQAACPDPGGSPVAGHASPSPQVAATPDAATPAAAGSVVDQDSFVEALRACGVAIETVGAVTQPFLHPESGETLRLSGGDLTGPIEVQVFAYRDEASAASDASGIGPDGNPPTMIIEWIEPPHFFRAGRVIVLYLGEDQATIDLLTALLGPQFAGR